MVKEANICNILLKEQNYKQVYQIVAFSFVSDSLLGLVLGSDGNGVHAEVEGEEYPVDNEKTKQVSASSDEQETSLLFVEDVIAIVVFLIAVIFNVVAGTDSSRELESVGGEYDNSSNSKEFIEAEYGVNDGDNMDSRRKGEEYH